MVQSTPPSSVHLCTRKCELERICIRNAAAPVVTLVHAVERSIMSSKQLLPLRVDLQRKDMNPANVAHRIGVIKTITRTTESSLKIYRPIEIALSYIRDMNAFVVSLSELQAQRYDSSNHGHEELLIKLWAALCPDVKLHSRISEQWQHIGFQGTDPATDFRSMGILALQNLVYFATAYNPHAMRVLADTNRPENRLKWFSFAVTGINLTFELCRLVQDRKLNDYFYQKGCNLKTFNDLYSYIFYRFNTEWATANLKDVMSFQGFKRGLFASVAQEDKVGYLATQSLAP